LADTENTKVQLKTKARFGMLNTIAQNPLATKSLSELKPDHLASLKPDAKDLSKPYAKPSPDAFFTPSTKASQLAQATHIAQMQKIEQSYQTSQTMNLQLTTKEGDKVTVDFRQLYAQYQSQTQTQQAEKTPTGVRYFESKETLEATAFEERFGFSVEGELNEAELNAVFEVFAQVDELANTFYNGDIEKAFEQAQTMKIDFGQLQSVQLDLTQSQSMATRYQQAALAQYSDVQKTDDSAKQSSEEYGVNMANLPPYLQRWQAAIEQLNTQFSEAQSTVEGLMADTLTQRFPLEDGAAGWLERVQNFHQKLLDWAQAQAVKPNQTPAEAHTAADNNAVVDSAEPVEMVDKVTNNAG
jgi:hypothetical protein